MSDFTKKEKIQIFKIETLQRESSSLRKDLSIIFAILVALTSLYASSDIVRIDLIIFSLLFGKIKYSAVDILLALLISCFILIFLLYFIKVQYLLEKVYKELFKYKPLDYSKTNKFFERITLIVYSIITLSLLYLSYSDYERLYNNQKMKEEYKESQKVNKDNFLFCKFDDEIIIGEKWARIYDKTKNIGIRKYKIIQLDGILYECSFTNIKLPNKEKKTIKMMKRISSNKDYKIDIESVKIDISEL